ncbi:hypothetical protein Dimus_028611 [Dionaea muscipula]
MVLHHSLIHCLYLFNLVGQEFREKFSGAVEAFARRNISLSGLHGDDNLRHKSLDDPSSSSKDVRTKLPKWKCFKRAVASTSRPSSSGEPSESRASRLLSTSGRMSTTQRIQPGFESKTSSLARASAARPGRDDALRSFEFLSIGAGKKK